MTEHEVTERKSEIEWHEVMDDDEPFEELHCSDCGRTVGMWTEIGEDAYGRETERIKMDIYAVFSVAPGRQFCEDCEYTFRKFLQGEVWSAECLGTN